MSINRIVCVSSPRACLTIAVVAGPTTAHAADAPAATPLPTVPQVPSAETGAAWLASRLNSAGYVP